ncbi:MAG: hypothetical protein H0W82_04730 [Actinobacteria bacterium]|nr:hypothetical protein [Actinomycetota bacterium]
MPGLVLLLCALSVNVLGSHVTLAHWHHPRFASGKGRVVTSDRLLPF